VQVTGKIREGTVRESTPALVRLFGRCSDYPYYGAMKINGIECIFHHIGIPTTEPKSGERFSERFGMYTSDSPCKTVRIQWHRFDANSSLHPLIRAVPHVALKVTDLESAIAGYNLLLAPYEPISGFRVAIIEDNGFPIELVQTSLDDTEVWQRAGNGQHALRSTNDPGMLRQLNPKRDSA
jgi:hypothetical protein